MIYEPAVAGDGVFTCLGVILTNDRTPRAVTSDVKPKSARDRAAVGALIEDVALLGAGFACVAPVVVGRWAMVAAGAVVTHTPLDYLNTRARPS